MPRCCVLNICIVDVRIVWHALLYVAACGWPPLYVLGLLRRRLVLGSQRVADVPTSAPLAAQTPRNHPRLSKSPLPDPVVFRVHNGGEVVVLFGPRYLGVTVDPRRLLVDC